MSSQTVISPKDMQTMVLRWKRSGATVGFVPTMGALHEGHLSLVKAARNSCDKVVVSIFVNPLQFGPNEDFSKYPRTLTQDLKMLEDYHVDAVFVPTAATIYPAGFQTLVSNSEMSKSLCGKYRPGHFDGVLTVVNKLFNLVQCDSAFFGKKDYQQFRLIEKMVRDLCLPVRVIGCDTLREPSGLAMSSRNRYLSEEDKRAASVLYEAMSVVKEKAMSGVDSVERLLVIFREHLAKVNEMRIQYVEICDAKTLEPMVSLNPVTSEISNEQDVSNVRSPVILTAVMFKDVRLIDNLELFGATNVGGDHG